MADNYIFDLNPGVTRTPVSYINRYGIPIAADLYRPTYFEKSGECPAVVIGPPYSGVKEQGPGIYAQNMALRGFVALAFDPPFNLIPFDKLEAFFTANLVGDSAPVVAETPMGA